MSHAATAAGCAVSIYPPDDPRWPSALEGVPHDVYQLPEYVALSARHEGGEAVAVDVRSGDARLFVPLLLRPLPAELGAPPEWRDGASPYGYPAPLLSGPHAARELPTLLRAFREAMAERGVVAAFFRLHPLLALPLDALAAEGEVVGHGETVPCDLATGPEAAWRETRGNHRTGINRLRRDGFEVRIGDWSLYPRFQEIYAETMRRVGAGGFYFFSPAYFDDLRRSLGERLQLLAVTSPAGDVAAAGLFTAVGDTVQYHLGGTDPAFLDRAPSKLMFHRAREWGAAEGFRWLHLGGGLGGAADALFHFKAGFSSLRAPFHTYRMVLDDGRYARLLRMREALGGTGDAGGFFPGYRAPLVPAPSPAPDSPSTTEPA